MALTVKWPRVRFRAGIKKLRKEEIIKRDDIVIGILTGKQKDPNLSIEYHLDANNRFSRPPMSR